MGKQDTGGAVGTPHPTWCQVAAERYGSTAVSLSLANETASLPIDYRLYLPKDWAADPARRAKAGVPDAIDFQTKPAIALDQIKRAVVERVPPGVVLADVALFTGDGGVDMKFQAGLLDLELSYVPVCRASARRSGMTSPTFAAMRLQAGRPRRSAEQFGLA